MLSPIFEEIFHQKYFNSPILQSLSSPTLPIFQPSFFFYIQKFLLFYLIFFLKHGIPYLHNLLLHVFLFHVSLSMFSSLYFMLPMSNQKFRSHTQYKIIPQNIKNYNLGIFVRYGLNLIKILGQHSQIQLSLVLHEIGIPNNP